MSNLQLTRLREQFRLAHGDDGIVIRDTIVFSDGASMDCHEGGMLREPPEDIVELSNMKAKYRKAQYEAAVAETNRLKAAQVKTPSDAIAEFRAAHGNDAILIDGWWVFSDGAKLERTSLPFAVMYSPPADAYALAKVQLLYREALLEDATEQFLQRRQLLKALATANRRNKFPPPGKERLQELAKLRAVVTQRQRDVNAARERVEQAMPDDLRRRREFEAQEQAAAEEFNRELEKLKI